MKTFFAATLVAIANSHATGYEHVHDQYGHHNAQVVPAPVSEYYAPVNENYFSQVPHGDF